MQGRRLYYLTAVLVLFLSIVMGGCAKKSIQAPETTGDPGAMGPPESLETDVTTTNIMEGRTSGPMLPVYFDFDSSSIRPDQVERIEANADFIKEQEDVRIRIEGNCDPRGTKEYNLALGERRALSAKRYLITLGVDESRLDTVSWGEEKLLLYGHDEISWAQNRRDDFVIIK